MMKKIILILISLMLLITSCGKESIPSWQEQYDLGMKYLSEENCEEAVVAFTAAIEIDSKQAIVYVARGDAYIGIGETEDNLVLALSDYERAVELDETNIDAYLGMAEVHIRQGEYEKALKILQEGLENTDGNQQIADKITEIEGGNIKDSAGQIRRRSGYDGEGNLIWYHQYKYFEDGKVKSVTSYDNTNAQTGNVEYSYNSDGKIIHGFAVFNTRGVVLAADYTYDLEGNPIKVIHYDENDEVSYYFENQYKNGNKIQENQYKANGTLIYCQTTEYDSEGRKISTSRYMEDGTIIHYKTFEYNIDGLLAGFCEYHDGQLYEKLVYQYDEEGNNIGWKRYDSDGNLKESVEKE